MSGIDPSQAANEIATSDHACRPSQIVSLVIRGVSDSGRNGSRWINRSPHAVILGTNRAMVNTTENDSWKLACAELHRNPL